MKKFVILLGQKFSHFTVIDEAPSDKKKNLRYLCLCECGKTAIVRGSRLIGNVTKSCGCKHPNQIKHGGKRDGKETPTYKSWRSMKSRCLNPNDPYYYRYGARGIRICDRWVNSFENFLSDMGERPNGMTLDRINGDGNYEPGNCRWATVKEQNRNHPNVKLTEEQVFEIRKLREEGIPANIIAQRFCVQKGYIYDIQHMRAWS